MYLFSKGGNKSVDVEIQALGDPSIKVQDLEDSRREIISLSGIPAPYLGYMDINNNNVHYYGNMISNKPYKFGGYQKDNTEPF